MMMSSIDDENGGAKNPSFSSPDHNPPSSSSSNIGKRSGSTTSQSNKEKQLPPRSRMTRSSYSHPNTLPKSSLDVITNSNEAQISYHTNLTHSIQPYLNFYQKLNYAVDLPPLRTRYTKKSLVVAYMLDWFVLILMFGLVGTFSLVPKPDPMFPLNDPSLSYPLLDEIIPAWLFFVLCVGVPIVLYIVIFFILRIKYSISNRRRRRRDQERKSYGDDRRSIFQKLCCICWRRGRYKDCEDGYGEITQDETSLSIAVTVESTTPQDQRQLELQEQKQQQRRFGLFDPHNLNYIGSHDMHHAVLGLLTSVMISLMFSSFLWVVVGGLRPNHYAECRIQTDKIVPGKLLYTVKEICASDAFDKFIQTPAFPSGHAANAFGCWVFTFLYLNGKFKIWDDHSHLWKVFLCFVLPLLMPIGIASSRYLDYHHSGFQILFGSLLGIGSGFLGYRLYFCAWFDNRFNHLATCFTWVSKEEYEARRRQAENGQESWD